MQFASMSLGIFDFLIEWLTQFLIWIVEFALGIVQQLIAGILYSTCVNFLEIVNYIQKIFYKLCGLDTYWYGGTEMKGADPLISIITEKSMLQVLLALTLVAVAMVIVATIIQVLRTEFSTEGSKNTKGQVFGQAIKAVIMFALVPICCGGGILITNALLKAVNTATSLGAESSVGGAVYVASTYGSNKIRNGGTITIVENNITVVGAETGLFGSSQKEKTITIDDNLKQNLAKLGISSANQTNRDDVAQAIDNAFRSGYLDFTNQNTANCFYDLGSINYIIFLGGGILAAYTMLMASFGMIMRMYKGAVLFVISPAMSGLMPLDNGSAFKQWRTAFIKQLLSAYGTIVAMNLLFILLPIVSNISLFGASDFAWKGGIHANLSNDVGKINAFVQMLFALTGLFMLKDMSSLIANMIGADDAGAAGAGMAGKVLGTAAKIGTVAVGGVAGVAAKGLGAGAGALAKVTGKKGFAMAANTFGGLGNKMTQKAKGTAGKALNKISNVATGGEFKGPFGEETDFGKAQEAKEKKKEARAKAVENGTAGFGASLGNKLDEFKKNGGDPDYIKDHKVLGRASNIIGGLTSGGTSWGAEVSKPIVEKKQETKASQAAANETIKDIKKNAEEVSKLGIDENSIEALRESLAKGDSLKASDDLTSMLQALNSLADKTEDQKDLIQKLTTLQGQIVATSNNKSAQGRLANSGFFNDIKGSVNNVNQTAQLTSSINIESIDTRKDVTAQLNNIATDIAQKVADSAKGSGKTEDEAKKISKDIYEKLQLDIQRMQKANLEELKSKKEKK